MPVIIDRQWKIGLGAAIGLMAVPVWLAAQVAIHLTLPSAKALLYEDVAASVVIQNNSGQTLKMDSARGPVRLWLDVERDDGRIVPRRDNTPLVSGEELMPGEVRTFTFSVPRLYAIRAQGLYKIRAGLEMNGARYESPEARLEVVSGFEFQRLTAGIPGDAQAVRTYVLSYFQKDGFENIYLRIEDADKNIYGMFNLGHVVRVRPTEIMLDESGNLHVLFQTMGMKFIHTAFTPFGVQLFARTYMGTRGKASLAKQPNGQVTVPDGIETEPPAPTAAEKAALDKVQRRTKTGGMVGQLMQPSDGK